jgi:hypothetical protein
LTACMIGSSESWGLNSAHFHGTHVPVEEPSTASKADIEPLMITKSNVDSTLGVITSTKNHGA